MKELIDGPEAADPRARRARQPRTVASKIIEARRDGGQAVAPFVTSEPLVRTTTSSCTRSRAPRRWATRSSGIRPRSSSTTSTSVGPPSAWRRGHPRRGGQAESERLRRWTRPRPRRSGPKIREDRIKRAVPFKEWWAEERKKVAATGEHGPGGARHVASSMELSPDYADELRAFWALRRTSSSSGES